MLAAQGASLLEFAEQVVAAKRKPLSLESVTQCADR